MSKLNPEDILIEGWPPPSSKGLLAGIPPVGVKVTHKPTGEVVTCLEHRHQYKNKDQAIKEMEDRLFSEPQ